MDEQDNENKVWRRTVRDVTQFVGPPRSPTNPTTTSSDDLINKLLLKIDKKLN